MTSSERDASVEAIKDALGVLGSMAAYPSRKDRMEKALDRIARKRGLPEEVRSCIRRGIIADLYELRQELITRQIPEEVT